MIDSDLKISPRFLGIRDSEFYLNMETNLENN